MIFVYRGQEIETFLEKNALRAAPDRVLSESVSEIIRNVRERGDEALIRYSKQFDGLDLAAADLKISNKRIDQAYNQCRESRSLIRQAAERIRRFHEKQRIRTWIEWDKNGSMLGQRAMPLERVGLYVPGGKAPYPSSLLMTAIPAQVAGVEEIAVVTPPGPGGKTPDCILAAARILGLDEIYAVGGAHAVAALAWGTDTIRAVDKIAGPGNRYVAEAKRQVFGQVAIDMIAGPSEVAIFADETAKPGLIAADLLAQAEHDAHAASVLVTWIPDMIDSVCKELRIQAQNLSRREIIESSLQMNGGILLAEDFEKAVGLINRIAPEHLGLHVKDPWSVLQRIRNAGAVFLGSFSPETAGDYWAGPSHVLPTHGTARFASPLNTADFMKFSSLIFYTREGINKDAQKIMSLANMEGLDGHANAIKQRLID